MIGTEFYLQGVLLVLKSQDPFTFISFSRVCISEGIGALNNNNSPLEGWFNCSSSACRACLLEFHARARLITHLNSKSECCAYFYRRSVPPLPEEIVEALDHDALVNYYRPLKQQGKSITHTNGQKTYQIEGPLPEGELYKLCRGTYAIGGKAKVSRQHRAKVKASLLVPPEPYVPPKP